MAGMISGSELTGRVALVTGAGRNIGRAIALELAAGGAGIVVNARSNRAEAESVAREIEAAGGKAMAILADVVDPAAVDAMLRDAVTHFGRLDILVNNAAIRREVPFAELGHAEWREVLETCLDGAFHCVKACLAPLKASGSGAIVNIGGLTAHTGGLGRAHVVTAKAGLVGLTRALAHDLAADGITVNCVSPGMIDTRRQTSSAPGEPAHHATRQTLAGRRGQPDEIAAAVRWLAGPGGRYVTGQTIHVNGGTYFGS
jgi:3-oxoacyl-[acyl-carrier protein] reductase